MAEKLLTTMRLTPEAVRLLARMKDQTGISHTALVELAIREKAARDLDPQARQRREATV